MRFALWAQNVAPHLLTVKQVSGLLDLSECSARLWLRDYQLAASPMFVHGIPPFLTPHSETPFTAPAAIGTAHTTSRS
ncbi:hypothetical protein [Thermomonas sp.]|uniref:hypothetical protein n=1 Tax=Thermomonas sp. TaxID=1971895 RepID=UPI0035AF73C8